MSEQFGYCSWLNSAPFKRNLKYTYLSTDHDEEQKIYHRITSLLVFTPGKNRVLAKYLNQTQYV